jgi:hypothetical protein
MPYSKYIKQSSLLIAETKEYPTDELIVHHVRNQELAQRIHGTLSLDDLDDVKIRGEMIVSLTVRTFRHELETIQDAVPAHFKDNSALFMLLYGNQLRSPRTYLSL